MIYALIVSVVCGLLFLFFYIKSEIANGALKNEILGLKRDVANKQKQLEIAANHPDTPTELADRMRKGTL